MKPSHAPDRSYASPTPHTPSALFELEDAVHAIRRAARVAVHCEQTIPPEDDLYLEIVGHTIRDIERAADVLLAAFTAAHAEMAASRRDARR